MAGVKGRSGRPLDPDKQGPGLCAKCQSRPRRKREQWGPVYYSAVCGTCDHKKWRDGRPRATSCAACGFVALDPCQIDIDHIDGNHTNGDPSNLRALCANCHRLKTKLSGDSARRYA